MEEGKGFLTGWVGRIFLEREQGGALRGEIQGRNAFGSAKESCGG